MAEATKQAIKRKIAQAASVDFQSRSLPAKLHINVDDPEDVVSSAYCAYCYYYFFLTLGLLMFISIKFTLVVYLELGKLKWICFYSRIQNDTLFLAAREIHLSCILSIQQLFTQKLILFYLNLLGLCYKFC